MSSQRIGRNVRRVVCIVEEHRAGPQAAPVICSLGRMGKSRSRPKLIGLGRVEDNRGRDDLRLQTSDFRLFSHHTRFRT